MQEHMHVSPQLLIVTQLGVCDFGISKSRCGPARPMRGRNAEGDLYVHNGTVGMAENNDRFRMPFRFGRTRWISLGIHPWVRMRAPGGMFV